MSLSIYTVIGILAVSLELFLNMLFLRKREHAFLDYLSLTLCEPDAPTLHLDTSLPGPAPWAGFFFLVPDHFWLQDFLLEMLFFHCESMYSMLFLSDKQPFISFL